MMRKAGTWLIGLALVAGSWSVGSAKVSAKPLFKDVSDRHWARAQIGQAVTKGYVSGYPDGRFDTKKAVTRAEFIKMIVGALRLPHSQGGSPWYQEYVAAALEFGLLDENDSKLYERPIRREEILSILSRGLAFETPYREYYAIFSRLRKTDMPFQDRDLMQKKDLPGLALAYGSGIVNGFPDGKLGIGRIVTRAETVVMIEKWLEARKADPLLKERLAQLKKLTEEAGIDIENTGGDTP